MSEYLQSKEYKQKILKDIIRDLHKGKDPDEVKERFQSLIKDVDATEIANMEQSLIQEGISPEEITKLCDVHAAVFKDALMENKKPELIPGHPLYSLKHENHEIQKILEELDQKISLLSQWDHEAEDLWKYLQERITFFKENLDKHYSKKENILFPYLERHNITGPPSVMWSVDDEIRDLIKQLAAFIPSPGNKGDLESFKTRYEAMKHKVLEMVFKEENILTPMMMEALTEGEWAEIKEQDIEFGVVFSRPQADLWQAKEGAAKEPLHTGTEKLALATGYLSAKEINSILTHLPIDITFVDKNDTVQYFSQGQERIFTRTKSIIGRKVQNCHPPESVHVVEKILTDFKRGKHSTAEFWLVLNGSFIHIRYFALRNDQGEYIGTMEVSQDVTKIRALEGERRLLHYQD
ncbi:DUF438 domain-containing protein [Desulforamulus ruminis]|uniref:PAS sensor protein n=1 Tax=Desulforamulus ruminis (strain ATCC 23193 / DSM 2154 / NCIMB 8452 / DL) TaxID=696281 RepID=F6DKG3_DESRL|nr:DUF438 domain-containing protein [Desulforamulus ruminis]AEG59223.1 PAS sensor protein [Desulforamulus ruminis DSM 2154]